MRIINALAHYENADCRFSPSPWLSRMNALSRSECIWEGGIVSSSRNRNPFTRKRRKLSKEDVLFGIIDIRRCTLSSKVSHQFYDRGETGAMPTAQAFSKARSNMNHIPLMNLFYGMIGWEYRGRWESGSLSTFGGRLVGGVDGSVIQLPDLPHLKEMFFDVNGAPSALISVVHDPMNNRNIAGDISDSGNEREAAVRLADILAEQYEGMPLLLVFDRGYFSEQLAAELEDRGLEYVFRMKSDSRYSRAVRLGQDKVLDMGGRKLRTLKFVLDSGEAEILATNVMEESWSIEAFRDLYHLRWGVELEYMDLKQRLHLEAFTGKTRNSILQDFWGSLLADLMISVIESNADTVIADERKDKGNKYEYKTNRSALIGNLRERFYKMLIEEDDDKRQKILQDAMDFATRNVIPVIPGRSFPRSRRFSHHHHNRKVNV